MKTDSNKTQIDCLHVFKFRSVIYSNPDLRELNSTIKNCDLLVAKKVLIEGNFHTVIMLHVTVCV